MVGLDPAAMAKELGLDADRLEADMNASLVASRMEEDIREARKCGLRSTPYLLVNGKVVDGVAAKELDFWDRMADLYWQEVGKDRPESTRLTKRKAA